jgi:hypothetical protein
MIEGNSFDAFMTMMVRVPEGREAGYLTALGDFGSILDPRCVLPAYPSMNTPTERNLNADFR